jgi:hypothetical protein
MDKQNIPNELLRAAIAWLVALLAGLVRKALGASRTVAAAASGAAGGLAALAVS